MISDKETKEPSLTPEDVEQIELAAHEVRPRFFRERFTHHEPLGIFFCENCGTTPYRDVPSTPRPTDPCPNCGFDDWIWEPAYQGLGKGPTQYD